MAWAKTFALCVGQDGPAPEEGLFDEILAFALSVLEMRLRKADGDREGSFLAQVKRGCRALRKRSFRPRGASHNLLSVPQSEPASSEFIRQYLIHAAETERDLQLTRERFEEFCRSTGLSSPALVGCGENLASLIFYIVVHGVFAANGGLSRKQMTDLLRTAQECRTHLQSSIDHWMTPVAAGSESAGQGRALRAGEPAPSPPGADDGVA